MELSLAPRAPSDLYDELRVGVGEALKFILVQVHDEELVCRRQLHRHLCELLVEVAHVSARFLPQRDQKKGRGRGRAVRKVETERSGAAVKKGAALVEG